MRRIPLFPTLIVAIAVATMVGLGIWQLRRAEWKEGMLASYRHAAKAPALHGIPPGVTPDDLAFRRSHVDCRITTAPILLGGGDGEGRRGFRTIVGCALVDGRLIMVDLGLSALGTKPDAPPPGQRIVGDGLLVPDDVLARRVLGDASGLPVLLVLDRAVPGLTPSVPPAIETIPNNHRSYAVQWFLFAAVAIVIYGLALRKRRSVR